MISLFNGNEEKRVRLIAVMVSVVLHLLLFLFWGYLDNSEKGLLELQEQLAQIKENQEKRLEFQLVETPDNQEQAEPDEETELVSDKNMKAADLSDNQLPVGDPFSEGDIDVKALADKDQQMVSQEQNQVSKEKIEEREEALSSNLIKKVPIKSEVSEKKATTVESSKLKKLVFDNSQTRARWENGLSLNTYAWDYAPYLLTLKRVIESNLNLPYAFTNMGIIGGEVIIKFVVNPKGQLQANIIIKTNAHESLQQASHAAISKSFPFLPLPEDFPEDRLEVTATFRYLIEKDKRN